MQKYITLEKKVGETPLSCAETYRIEHKELEGVSMAYAGRLDPMASGKLLILLGDECKNQSSYHDLDKEYVFSVLLGVTSDSLDVLGRLQTNCTDVNKLSENSSELLQETIQEVATDFVGEIELPYPNFSSKTVQGKPLHTWTLENRLSEIAIPTKQSSIYALEYTDRESLSREDATKMALEKVNSIPKVTDERKSLGNDFRRVDIRLDWEKFRTDESLPSTYTIITFKCIASSGTYMRTLAKVIAEKLDTCGLAWNIHRTKIGSYDPINKIWSREF